METTKRAAIYTRISKDREGTELGVVRQEKSCRAIAAANGYESVVVFAENDTSASTRSKKPRPKYAEMMARTRDGEFTAIVAYSYSRLTRRPQEFNDIIQLAEDRNVRIITVASGEFDLNLASGRGVARTIAAWDAVEAEQASERIRAAKAQRAERGEWHGGAPPYGYRSDNPRLVIEPDEAERVREATKRLLDFRESMNSIVKDWNALGVTTRGGHHWRQSNLRSILRNRALLGETKAGVVGWEPILDARTFDRLQVLFDDPARKIAHSPGVKGGKYSMGGGLTVCARCGKPLTSTRTSRGTAALICNKQVQGPHPAHDSGEGPKGRVKIEHNHLEAFVFGKVIALLDNTPRWQQRMSEPDPAIDTKIDALEAQRADLQDQRARAGQAFIAGIMSEAESKREVDRIAGELESLAVEINGLLGRPDLAVLTEGGIDWVTWLPGQRRAFLRLFIDRIEVGDYPHGVARNGFRKSGETDAEYAERQRERREVALDQRVQIVWKWAERAA
jgi:site-specific DNA recombinase